jgi:hypothetical protein
MPAQDHERDREAGARHFDGRVVVEGGAPRSRKEREIGGKRLAVQGRGQRRTKGVWVVRDLRGEIERK